MQSYLYDDDDGDGDDGGGDDDNGNDDDNDKFLFCVLIHLLTRDPFF